MASEDCGVRINRNAKVDRISNLQDEILSEILSLLPTKCAVGTSILSNRWKYLWTSITNLHFESPKKDKGFTNFVDKVFRSCNSSNIQKVTMHVPLCWNYNSRVVAWIDEAIKRNVREVDIKVYMLPMSIFKCTTLTDLKLAPDFSYDPDIYSFDLPCLKVLYIHRGNLSKSLLQKLITSCPVLEDLILDGSFSQEMRGSFMVHAPTLKSLRLQLAYVGGDLEFSVEAPNLKYLYLSKYFVKCRIKGDFSSLVKANVNFGVILLNNRDIPFHLGRRDLFTLPKFDHLKSLEITSHHPFWSMLPEFMRITPSLEVLSIKQPDHNMPPDEFIGVGPKLLPQCLCFHISTIKLEGFKGRNHELELLRYLLGNAKVLQRLIINCSGLKCVEKMEFAEQLTKIFKASKCCKIQFQGDLISD